jgi:hypothetical protein
MFSVVRPTTDIPANVCFAPEAALGGIEIKLPPYPRKRLYLEIAAFPKGANSEVTAPCKTPSKSGFEIQPR